VPAIAGAAAVRARLVLPLNAALSTRGGTPRTVAVYWHVLVSTRYDGTVDRLRRQDEGG